MQDHERRVVARVADEIQRYRDGGQTMLQLLNRSWGLYEAAELRDPADRDEFLDVYNALTTADDANRPWMPAGLESNQAVEAALRRFEEYARGIQDQESDSASPSE
jgi:hypothetical protein